MKIVLLIVTQDLKEFWQVVGHESSVQEKRIQELDETFLKYETERASQVAY